MTRANDIATMIKDGRFIDYSRIPALLITEYPTIVAGSSTATLSDTYDITKLEVYLNGVLLKQTTEYTLSGTTLTLAGGEVFSSGDVLTIKVFKADANNVNLLFTNAQDVNISNIADGELLKFDSATSKVIPTSLVEDGNGNVGIGTSSPTTKFSVVSGSSNAGISVNDGTVNTIVYNTNSVQGSAGTTTNHPFTFWTNNAERMRIDTSGNVTKPSNPAFVVRHNNNTLITGDIVWTTVATNIGSHYNSTNGRFTAPVTGLYYFTAHTLVQNASSGQWIIAFYKNGSAFLGNQFIHQKDANTWQNLHINAHAYLNANDYVTVYMSSSSGAIYLDANYNQFSGHLVG